MPTVESGKKDIESLGTAGKEEILQYLEELFVLTSFATEVANEVKENRFSRGKVCPHCRHNEVSIICIFILYNYLKWAIVIKSELNQLYNFYGYLINYD